MTRVCPRVWARHLGAVPRPRPADTFRQCTPLRGCTGMHRGAPRAPTPTNPPAVGSCVSSYSPYAWVTTWLACVLVPSVC
eukprot:1864572-Prymnesium_polylepis.1